MKQLEEWLKENNKEIKTLTNYDWLYISRQCKLSEDFIREFQDKLELQSEIEVSWRYKRL